MRFGTGGIFTLKSTFHARLKVQNRIGTFLKELKPERFKRGTSVPFVETAENYRSLTLTVLGLIIIHTTQTPIAIPPHMVIKPKTRVMNVSSL